MLRKHKIAWDSGGLKQNNNFGSVKNRKDRQDDEERNNCVVTVGG